MDDKGFDFWGDMLQIAGSFQIVQRIKVRLPAIPQSCESRSGPKLLSLVSLKRNICPQDLVNT